MEGIISPNQQEGLLKTSVLLKNEIDLLDIEGKVEFSGKTLFIKAESDPENFNQLCTSVRKQSRDLSRILKNDTDSTTITERYLRHGSLDDTKIADMISGSKNAYTKRSTIETVTGVNIVLLIDESGSMQGDKITAAAQCAILIQQAVKFIPKHNLFIYGFTSDYYNEGDNVITIYKEPGFDSVQTLGSIYAKSSNRDGTCILEAAKRVRTFTKAKTLFFVISDGSPNAENYYGDCAIEHTHSSVKEIESMNFIPFQIGIQTNPATQARMFTDFITYSDSSEMVKDIKKTLVKKLRKHIFK